MPAAAKAIIGIVYYGITQLINIIGHRKITNWQKLLQLFPAKQLRSEWKNIGGQLIPANAVHTLIRNIRSAKINSWDDVHDFFKKKSSSYQTEKFQHAFSSLMEILTVTPKQFTKKKFILLLEQAVVTKEWISKGIYDSRAKDYENPFRQMVYETEQEMEKVIGKLADNNFINQQKIETIAFKNKVNDIIRQFK